MQIQIGPNCWRCGKQMVWRMCGACMGEGCEYCGRDGGTYFCRCEE